MAVVKDDIDLYLKTETEQLDRLNRIRMVNPEWKPPTVSERIVSFLTEKGASTRAEIEKGIGGRQLWLGLKKLTDAGTVEHDKKTDKYSVPCC